ncbi:Transcription factor TFIIIB component B [Dinochytrium kinnereticum]|nr:Transcription factor TFIIIB component B [Dinochytrium kinnereticum]
MFVSSRVNKGGPGGIKPKFKPGGSKPSAAPAAPATAVPPQATPSDPLATASAAAPSPAAALPVVAEKAVAVDAPTLTPAASILVPQSTPTNDAAENDRTVTETQSTSGTLRTDQSPRRTVTTPDPKSAKKVHFSDSEIGPANATPSTPALGSQRPSPILKSVQPVEDRSRATLGLPPPAASIRRSVSPDRPPSPISQYPRIWSDDEDDFLEPSGRSEKLLRPPRVFSSTGREPIVRSASPESDGEQGSQSGALQRKRQSSEELSSGNRKRSHTDKSDVSSEGDIQAITSAEDLKRVPLRALMALRSKVLKESPTVLKRREELKQKKRDRGSSKEPTPSLEEPGALIPKSGSQATLPSPAPVPVARSQGPKIHIVNGEIQIDSTSLLVSAADVAEQEEMEVVDESAANQYVTASSFRKTTSKKRWSIEETDYFHQCLQWFGTDFGMISQLFPLITRRHVKLKFTHEEKTNSQRVTRSLLNRVKPPEEIMEKFRENQTRRLEESRRAITEKELEQAMEQTEESSASAEAGRTNQEGLSERSIPQAMEDVQTAASAETNAQEAPAPTPEVTSTAKSIPVTIQRVPVAIRASTAKPRMNFKPTMKKKPGGASASSTPVDTPPADAVDASQADAPTT